MQNIQTMSRLMLVGQLLLTLGSCSEKEPEVENSHLQEATTMEMAKESPSDTRAAEEQWSIPVKSLSSHIDWRARQNAAAQLGSMGADAKGAVPALISALSDRAENVRIAVIEALVKIGPANGVPATPLVKRLSDPEKKVRAAAVKGLISMGAHSSIPLRRLIDQKLGYQPLSEMSTINLTEDEWHRLSKAAIALREIGPEAYGAVPVLIKLANVSCDDVRARPSCFVTHGAATTALGRMGEKAVPLFIPMLENKSHKIRLMAAKALENIGPPAKDAVPILFKMLSEEKVSISRAAAKALGGIGAAAIPPLLQALHDKHPIIREPAVKALIRMGPAAKQAAPELEEMLNDPKRWTRRAAKDVLDKI